MRLQIDRKTNTLINIYMGQYIVIGIATSISADKARVAKEFKDTDSFKALFEKEFNHSGIYQLEETDERIRLRLKPEIAEREWIDFIGSFFKIRYTEDYRQASALNDLSQAANLQAWMDLANKHKYQCYQSIHLYYYPMENPNYYHGFSVEMDIVGLSFDGKIIMECYNDLFAFLTRTIRERLSDYRIANGLFVYLTE